MAIYLIYFTSGICIYIYIYATLNIRFNFRLWSLPGRQNDDHFENFWNIFERFILSLWHRIWKDHGKLFQKKYFWRWWRQRWRHNETEHFGHHMVFQSLSSSYAMATHETIINASIKPIFNFKIIWLIIIGIISIIIFGNFGKYTISYSPFIRLFVGPMKRYNTLTYHYQT